MLLKEAIPTLQRPRRREPAVIESDPAALSASLRELAVRAHRLVRSADEIQSRPTSDADPGFRFNLEQELSELRSEIVQLERRLKAQNLGDLAAYVSALRQRVSDSLA
jgi:hypothetical protein